jgi:hypothetical protein
MENINIERLLTPLLAESMKASLDAIIMMKEENSIEKGDTQTINFLNLFLKDAFEFYNSIEDTQNLAILSDLKNYLSKLT